MTYVISDIHGRYFDLLDMLEKIRFTQKDTLYVLGDLVDRGPDSLLVLADLQERENVHLLWGNHDFRMLSVLKRNTIKTMDDVRKIRKTDVLMNEWLHDGGIKTIRTYCAVTAEQKENILYYLENAFSISELITVNGKNFFLSHTVPGKRKMQNLDECEIEDFLYGSPEYGKRYFENVEIVTGHTPTIAINPKYKGRILQANGHIAIDCGAYITGILGCLCLDTMEEYYIDCRKYDRNKL